MKIYKPKHLDKIMHISKEGKVYQLDSLWKMGVIAENLKQKYPTNILDVDGTIDINLFKEFHTNTFVDALVLGKDREKYIESCGVFWQPYLPQAMFNRAMSAVLALENIINGDKLSVMVADGGHHTTPEKAYGFGPINAIGIAINNLKTRLKDKKIIILDLDVHRSNGFSFIESPNVYIYDIWNKALEKWKVNTKNQNYRSFEIQNVEEYKDVFELVLKEIIDTKPDYVIYYSGADVLESDRMSGISGFTLDVFHDRETKVFETLSTHRIPVVLTIGGGYVNYKNGNIEEEQKNLIKNHLYSIETAIKYLG